MQGVELNHVSKMGPAICITSPNRLLSKNPSTEWASCQMRKIAGAHAPGNAGNVFPATGDKQSRHASRHVRHARAVMHTGIANQRFPLESMARENVPGIPGACATRNFTYLTRAPWVSRQVQLRGYISNSQNMTHFIIARSNGV